MAIGLACCALLLYLPGMRPGHDFIQDDYALYVAHAANLAEGLPYCKTGYIYNAENPVIGPACYPPVYPALLAPVYRWRGADLAAMKRMTALFFPLFLVAVFLVLEAEAGPPAALAVSAMLACNPQFWLFRQNLYPDIPFCAFLFLGLWLWRKAHSVAGAVLAGVVLYLCVGTRTAGLAAIPALLLADRVREGKVRGLTWIAAGVPLAGFLLQSALIPGGGYLDLLRLSSGSWGARRILWQIAAIGPSSLADLCASGRGYSPVLRATSAALAVALAPLAAWGLWLRVRRGAGALEFLALFYCGLLTIIYDTLRYLFPIVPIFFMCVCAGLAGLGGAFARARRPLVLAVGALMAFNYGFSWLIIGAGPMRQPRSVLDVQDGAVQDFLAGIRALTPPDAVIVSCKPRTVALFTGRRSGFVGHWRDDADFSAWLSRNRVSHVAVSGLSDVDTRALKPLLDRHPESFRKLFANPAFEFYEVRGR